MIVDSRVLITLRWVELVVRSVELILALACESEYSVDTSR